MNEERRSNLRIDGPFDAIRTEGGRIQLSNLSEGGCFVNSFEPHTPGRRWAVQIELPGEGWIDVVAETLHIRTGYGYGARFVDMSADNRARLRRCLEELGEEPQERA